MIALLKDNQLKTDKFLCLIPGVCVAVIAAVIFSLNNLYPFGELAVSWCDMDQQVIPLMLDFKDILSGNDSIFLNMHNAGGINFWGVFLFFICSPFSFLAAFVDKTDMRLFMNVLIIIKMTLCAVTASIFFKKSFKRLDIRFNIMLSIMYSFCGYVMLFYQNIVWLDVMCLFPLLVLSFEKLIYERKVLPYIICISAMIVIQFYLGYMIVLYTLLFFGAYAVFEKNKDNKKTICLLFVSGSVIGAMLTAVVWLPSFIQYVGSARGSSVVEQLKYCDFIAEIATTGVILTCSAIITAALSLINGCIKGKKSKIYLTLFICTAIPIFIEPINKMWHTGSYQAFPARYGFETVFTGLILAAFVLSSPKKEIPDEKSQKKSCLILGISVVALFCVLALKYSADNIGTLDAYTSTLWGNTQSAKAMLAVMLLFTVPYFTVMYMYKNGKLKKALAALLILPVMLTECLVSTNIYIVTAANSDDSYEAVVSMADKIDDEEFFRVKSKDKYFEVNLIGGMGYNTMGHYTSLNSEDYMFTMKKLGYSSYWMEVGSHGGTLFTDALLCNKYSVNKFKYDEKYGGSYYGISRTEFFMPLGVLTDSDLSLNTEIKSRRRFDIQQEVFESIFNTKEDLFTEYDYTSCENLDINYNDEEYTLYRTSAMSDGCVKYDIFVSGKEMLYFDCFDKLSTQLKEHINSSFDIYVNGIKIYSKYPGQSYNGLLELGTFENENVSIEVYVKDDVYCASYGVAGLKYSVLDKYVSKAECANLTVSGNKISGSCTCDGERWMFIAIPYDKGFTAYINGEKADTVKAYSGFMAVKLKSGINNIRITYMPSGFAVGAAVSAAGLVLLLFFALKLSKKITVCKRLGTVCCVLTVTAAAAAVFAVYVMPVIINILF